jgi:hypothetical protein
MQETLARYSKFNSGEATMKGSISETSASLLSRNQKAAACHHSEMFTRIKPATGSSLNITQGMCSAQMQQHYIPLLRNPFLPCSYHDCARISCPRHCLVCSPTRITGSQADSAHGLLIAAIGRPSPRVST